MTPRGREVSENLVGRAAVSGIFMSARGELTCCGAVDRHLGPKPIDINDVDL
jgi:hypothetical protein